MMNETNKEAIKRMLDNTAMDNKYLPNSGDIEVNLGKGVVVIFEFNQDEILDNISVGLIGGE